LFPTLQKTFGVLIQSFDRFGTEIRLFQVNGLLSFEFEKNLGVDWTQTCNHSHQHAPNRVLARIIFKRTKKHVASTMTRRLGEIFLVKCQKQAFYFNKREAKVYCYAFMHVLKRDACIKHEKTILKKCPG
jgi:hypothetical protein